MFQCVLIEDEPLAVTLLEKYIQQIPSLKITEKVLNQRQLDAWLSKKNICDIIFMDLNIGIGKGVDQIPVIKKQCRFLILTTAYFLEEIKASQDIDWRYIGFLHKPFTYHSLLEELRRLGCVE